MANKKFDYEKDIEPGFYDRIYRKKTGSRYWWHQEKFTRAIQIVNKLDDFKPVEWLDIGTGPGTFLGQFHPAPKMTGIDLSAAQIKYAKEHYSDQNISFTTDLLPALIESGQQFDAVSMLELIEHIEFQEVDELFSNVNTLLKPGGALILSTPNYLSAWPFIEIGLNMVSKVKYKHQHINKYTKGKLLKQMNQYFSTQIYTGVGITPFLAVFGNSIQNWTSKLERSLSYLGIGNLLFAIGMKKPVSRVSP